MSISCVDITWFQLRILYNLFLVTHTTPTIPVGAVQVGRELLSRLKGLRLESGQTEVGVSGCQLTSQGCTDTSVVLAWYLTTDSSLIWRRYVSPSPQGLCVDILRISGL